MYTIPSFWLTDQFPAPISVVWCDAVVIGAQDLNVLPAGVILVSILVVHL
jgi:hypothetical protein